MERSLKNIGLLKFKVRTSFFVIPKISATDLLINYVWDTRNVALEISIQAK